MEPTTYVIWWSLFEVWITPHAPSCKLVNRSRLGHIWYLQVESINHTLDHLDGSIVTSENSRAVTISYIWVYDSLFVVRFDLVFQQWTIFLPVPFLNKQHIHQKRQSHSFLLGLDFDLDLPFFLLVWFWERLLVNIVSPPSPPLCFSSTLVNNYAR